MKTYLISYNLKPGNDYAELERNIKSYGTWAHVLGSTWLVVSDKSAKDIREHLSKYIDKDDSLIVVRSGREAAWRNIIAHNEWLHKYLGL